LSTSRAGDPGSAGERDARGSETGFPLGAEPTLVSTDDPTDDDGAASNAAARTPATRRYRRRSTLAELLPDGGDGDGDAAADADDAAVDDDREPELRPYQLMRGSHRVGDDPDAVARRGDVVELPPATVANHPPSKWRELPEGFTTDDLTDVAPGDVVNDWVPGGVGSQTDAGAERNG